MKIFDHITYFTFLLMVTCFNFTVVHTFRGSECSCAQQARIALERRKFLKNANAAVQRQTAWSNLAHEMTAEFRGLCAEEVGTNIKSLTVIDFGNT